MNGGVWEGGGRGGGREREGGEEGNEGEGVCGGGDDVDDGEWREKWWRWCVS